MELKYIFSLFIIYSLILSVLLESTDLVDHKSVEDDEDYDYEDETTPTTISTRATSRPTRRKPPPPPTQRYFPDLDDVRPINPCPEKCVCNKFSKFVNCSGLALTEIPARLPQDTRTIDLSHNFINEIKATDFINCSEVQDINLAYNKLSGLSQDVLKNIENINKLNISHNELPKLNVTTFSNMLFLKSLDLSYNPIVLGDDHELIWAENLNELSVEGCGITNFHNNTFRKLEKLTLLNIKNNAIIDDELNVESFRPLKMLSTLKISNITKNKTEELCKILETVDKIETTHFTISCFELEAGLKFEDSVIAIKISTTTERNRVRMKNKKFDEQHVYSQVNNASNDVTTPSTTTIVAEPSVTGKNDSKLALSNNATITEIHPLSQNTTSNEKPAVASSDYINHILIGIIAVCCTGLIIGLICRADVCGIKTKCCRTKRPRNDNHHDTPAAEEVPLNKVVSTTS